MSLNFFSGGRSPTCASANGWMAVQMWAQSIAGVQNSGQIRGFPIVTRQLASLIRGAGGSEEIAARLPSSVPSQVSQDLLSLHGSETARQVGAGISEQFEARLIDQAKVLRRLSGEPATPVHPLFRTDVQEAPIEDPNQLIAYGASLSLGAPNLARGLMRLEALVTSSPVAIAVSDDFLTGLERARKTLADLQRFYRKITGSKVALSDFQPKRYQEPLQKMEDALKEFATIQEDGYSERSLTKIRGILLALAIDFNIPVEFNPRQ